MPRISIETRTDAEMDAVLKVLAPSPPQEHISYTMALRQARAWQEIIKLAPDRKIEAIKACRALTGLGLKEAKDLVESL